MSIKIFNPNDKPYGKLSNNFEYQMFINNEPWNTVSQYIYTNMTNVLYGSKIKNSKTNSIYYEFQKYKKKTEDDIISQALTKALEVKFKDPKMMELLVSTQNSEILYISDNDFLGTGNKNKGFNKFGKVLMYIRDEYIRKETEEKELRDKEESLYKTYIAYYVLEKLIEEEGDILKYRDMSLDEIINSYSQEKLTKSIPSKQVVLDLIKYEEGERKFYTILLNKGSLNPNILIYQVRKDKLRGITIGRKISVKEKIFNLYIDYFIEKNYPNVDHEKLKKQKINSMDWRKKEELKNRIFDFKDNPNPIEKKINKIILETQIAHEHEIADAEDFDINNSETYTHHDFIQYKDEPINFASYKFKRPASPTYKPVSENEDLNEPDIKLESTDEDVETNWKKIQEHRSMIKEDTPALTKKELKNKKKELREEEKRRREEENNSSDEEEKIENESSPEEQILGVKKRKIFYDLFDKKGDLNSNNNEKIFNPKEDILNYETEEEIKFKNQEDSEFDNYKKFLNEVYKKETPIKKQKKRYSGQPIKIFQNNKPNYDYSDIKNGYNIKLLSPHFYTGMLIIDDTNYPTVSHYLIANLFSYLPEIKTLKNAQQYMFKNNNTDINYYDPSSWLSYEDLYIYYDYEYDRQYEYKIKQVAESCLNIKFLNFELQDILLMTENKELIWESKDHVLGTGKGMYYPENIEQNRYTYIEKQVFSKEFTTSKPVRRKIENKLLKIHISNEELVENIRKNRYVDNGQNFVGKYLMILRNNIKTNRINENKQILTDKNFYNIENDYFIKTWMELKINNISKVVIKIKKYLKNSKLIDLELNSNRINETLPSTLFETILQIIYTKPCNQIYKLSSKLNTDNITLEFMNLVREKIRVNNTMMEVIWKYIFSILLFLVKHIENPTLFNLKKTLYKVDYIVSKKNKCVIMFNSTNEMNCIICAIINILIYITKIYKESKNFVQEKIKDFKIGKDEINLAVSIILNINISKKIEKIIEMNKDFEQDEENEESKEQNQEDEDDIPIMEEDNVERELTEEELLEKELERILREEQEDNFINDDDQRLSDQEEFDYPSGEDENEERDDNGDGMGFSKFDTETREDQLYDYIKMNNIININKDTIIYMFKAATYIKNHNMNKKVKRQTINFFCNLE
jgi:predicted NAD-dependent protein-ADP-ribosyltransferase YbiA (DUF1768 family)